MAAPWLQSVDGWAFLSENDDQLIFCHAAITHDMYLSLSQPIKHRKFIKILSFEVITNDRIFHLNVLVYNTVFCLRDPQGKTRQGRLSLRSTQWIYSQWPSYWRSVATQKTLVTWSFKKKFLTLLLKKKKSWHGYRRRNQSDLTVRREKKKNCLGK